MAPPTIVTAKHEERVAVDDAYVRAARRWGGLHCLKEADASAQSPARLLSGGREQRRCVTWIRNHFFFSNENPQRSLYGERPLFPPKAYIMPSCITAVCPPLGLGEVPVTWTCHVGSV